MARPRKKPAAMMSRECLRPAERIPLKPSRIGEFDKHKSMTDAEIDAALKEIEWTKTAVALGRPADTEKLIDMLARAVSTINRIDKESKAISDERQSFANAVDKVAGKLIVALRDHARKIEDRDLEEIADSIESSLPDSSWSNVYDVARHE